MNDTIMVMAVVLNVLLLAFYVLLENPCLHLHIV